VREHLPHTGAEERGQRAPSSYGRYLSDVDEGGETAFPDLRPPLAVKPRKGSAILWPSVQADDNAQVDWRTKHEARPVIAGVKLAANAWIHLHDFRMAGHWGCTGSFD